jgi:ketosteroid isomerase-like protein
MSSLATRQPKPEEKEIIDEVLDLYQLKPSEKAYSHYSETAVFHDPVSIAKGKKSIQSQFNGMPKIFSESITKRMLSN